ncbi:MAG: methylmalonyl Co-A mutase-associated GTPase MeaB [Flavobacteriales bacterium]|nr:methylmalonyl Co-A mutase-associated GTPase MeaB [Flavobacteriales bacterium]
MGPSAIIEGILRKDRAALARAITLVESQRPVDRRTARALLEQVMPAAGKAFRIGITGIPGVGKSTLIEALGMSLIGAGHRVAVLAVDPSSGRGHGSILGDKTRMERLAQQDAAFIRPTPSGGALGGVARRTREAILLCEAAGHDRVLIETVGVGQSELEVDQLCDLNVLLMIAGAGDELQGIKRGIMESADLVVFTKCDAAGDAASSAARDTRNALALLPPRPGGRRPDVVLTDALTGRGIAELVDKLEALRQTDEGSGHTAHRRREQDVHWMRTMAEEDLLERFRGDDRVMAGSSRLEQAVREGKLSPQQAALMLLEVFRTGGAPRSE